MDDDAPIPFDPDNEEEDGDDGPWRPCVLTQILATDPPNASYVVVLREVEGGRAFPIHIGKAEWQAIHQPVHGVTPARPMTHDLLLSCLAAAEAELVGARVRDLLEDDEGNGTFFGSVVLAREDGRVEVDCRPSDALALTVRTGCPIAVHERVLARMAGDPGDD